MIRFTVAYLAVAFAAGFVHADDTGKLIAERVQQLTATTQWNLVREIPLEDDVFHPQGMAIVEGQIFISSVEVTNRAKEEGLAHLLTFTSDGLPLDASGRSGSITTNQTKASAYHAGGMDFDGEWLWIPMAEYKPDGLSAIWLVNPKTREQKNAMIQAVDDKTGDFLFHDHLGLVINDPISKRLVAASWGSRTFYSWQSSITSLQSIATLGRCVSSPNRSHYVDLQDGQWLRGTTLMLCGGLKNYKTPNGNLALGGLELIDMQTLEPKHQVPVSLWEPGGRPMLQNAFHCEATETGLRFWFLPGDGKATIYIYEPELAEK